MAVFTTAGRFPEAAEVVISSTRPARIPTFSEESSAKGYFAETKDNFADFSLLRPREGPY
jgi:hypothetical protein